MVTGSKRRKSGGSKKRFIGKPNGQVQDRVQAVGPEHFGVVAVDCAKRRSKWMLLLPPAMDMSPKASPERK